MKTVRGFILILLTSVYVVSNAQDVRISDKIERINNKDYYIHIIQKGESVWRIAKAYSVTEEDIYSVNPEAKKEIKPGQILKIIVKNRKTVFENHTVEKGETLYKISKKYKVDITTLKEANPDITEKIKQGQVIKIPVVSNKSVNPAEIIQPKDTASGAIEQEKYNCNNPKKLESYNIAVMIPFYLNQVYQINTEDPKIDETDPDEYSSFLYIQFYEGILMAIDSLKKQGFSAKIHVYDVDDDSVKTIALLQKPEFKSMHLIIGPFFPSSLKPVIAFAKMNNIKVVDPISTNDEFIKNSNVIKAVPSVESQFSLMASFFIKDYPTSNIIIAHNNKSTEAEYSTILKEALEREVKKSGRTKNNVKEAIINQVGIDGIIKMLNPLDTNIIITLTSGEVFVTNYLRNLNNYYDSYKIIVVGMPSWRNYDKIEVEYMQNINLHYFSSSFIDYSSENVKKFVSLFRNEYKTEPNKYAFHGFDIGMIFFSSIWKYGLSFEKCLDAAAGKYLQSDYYFVKKGNDGGYENQGLNIYRYYQYNLIDARNNKRLGLTEKSRK